MQLNIKKAEYQCILYLAVMYADQALQTPAVGKEDRNEIVRT